MSSHAQHQLTLNIQLRDDATLDNFFDFADTRPLVQAIKNQANRTGESLLYCYGPSGSGKTHLLNAACHCCDGESGYLPLKELVAYPAEEVLAGMESMSLVCLDDLDAICGNTEWELSLFHFFNRARESDCRVLFSACSSPRGLAIELPDLLSRLSWCEVYQLPAQDDETKAEILSFRATRRGLLLSEEVARYVVNRAPRALSALLELLQQLDESSLAHKRPLTIPFVKEQLGW